MSKKVLMALVCLIFCYAPATMAYTSDKEKLEDYVEKLMQDSYELFQDKSLSKGELESKIAKLIRSHLYFDWMAKQSLGRMIRTLPAEKVERFKKAYANFVEASYTNLVSSYKGEKGVLIAVKELNNNLFIVDTEIVQPKDNSKFIVKYLIHEVAKDGGEHFLVGDIITEGVSVLDSHKSEFRHVISEKGIDHLIDTLEKKAQK